MKFLLLFIFVVAGFAQSVEPIREFSRDDLLWRASFVAFATTQALDVHSSHGKRELNPMFQGAGGQFDTSKAVAIKSGLVVGTFLIQNYTNQRHPRLRKFSTIINFGLAVGYSFVLRHNYSVDRMPSNMVGYR